MEDFCSHSVLCHLTCLLLLVQLPTAGSVEEFLVFSPSDPIVAVLGRDVTLRCRVFPTMSVEDMEPMWFSSKFSEAVFIYQNQQEQNEEQVAQYVGRTSLARRDLLTQGEAAVRIHNVQVSYNGLYTCSFRKGSLYKEATFELKVAGVGSAPAVRITGPEEDGVRVVCTASGWFPKPQVQWRDLRGGKFLAFSEAHAQDAEGLFSVEATLVVRDSSVGNVTCSLLNPVLGQEKAMAIFIPAPFFPQASPWKLAFQVSLTVLMILLLGAGCYTRREHATKLQEVAKKKRLCLDKEQDQREQEEARKEIGELQAQLAWRKSVYLAAWRKAQLYAETMERSVVRGDGSRIMTQESLISTRFQQPCLPAWDSGFPKGAFWFLIRVAPKLLLFWIYFWFSGVFLVLWAIRLLSAAFSLTPCPGCVSSSKTP
uniref:Butyrophilin-like protein 1 isoform X1 n=1 Tax=Camelus bactrianus TaxID=9837 RepID=A0A9W3HEZ1_CAMBA|nr:butyrophilin-like protein 1 isoform X1 [Camelus bactrianus]XP_045370554.1 butyrophilin-like protein 1 isoform X1 [Camelus bactrianus]XP_045370555.1 butyrophilin-like protein 1 isoform X1 [Camelus bactrianus]XP_045370556.1 butyrophilin-like protein 1 isoform X1 [Camelus bactrianus]XP_045370557.1 butyrophilin-like protein 1 isoform X1 [Camelus bactrianus]XP_045370558.1 butyrophilin-like protein 1 isoform X1 [Camelus bactrianus]XP_045370559.1 butyrophilin-like protein 1 isoform X1 [Camelus ba